MNKNNIIITSVAILALIVGVIALNRTPVNTTTRVVESLGAVNSPDIQSPYFSFGNLRMWANSSALTSGSATLCAIQSPAATSTLVTATLGLTNPSYTNNYEIGWGASSGATTTNLARATVAASTWISLIATTSATALTDGVVLPNSWINFKVATGTASSVYAPTGKCSVVFREI